MSNLKNNSTVTVQRDKNQITIPASIVKQIKAKKGTKYRAEVDSNGNIILKVIKNDIEKYTRLINSNKSAAEMIRESRIEDEKLSEQSMRFSSSD